MACSNCFGVVGCTNSLLDHFVEKVGPNDPKILSLVKREKKWLNDVGHVIGEEKYEWVRLNVLIRWLRIEVESVYWVNLRGLIFGILYLYLW